jgi:hypothetical protein
MNIRKLINVCNYLARELKINVVEKFLDSKEQESNTKNKTDKHKNKILVLCVKKSLVWMNKS